jgi:uncharacterized surface protein with fasciclin (FAS1) repeats
MNSQGEADMQLLNGKLTLTLSAAAVAFALGTAPGVAQQQGGAQGSQQQGAQQSQGGQQSGAQSQQQGAQRSQQQSGQSASQQGQSASGQQRAGQSASGQQQGQSPSSQQRTGDSQLDRVVQMHAEIGTFVEALETAGLVEELAGDAKYTIFAPTNQAFEAMQRDVAELLKPENRQQLVSLLRAHIVADDVDPQRARQLPAARTLDGGTIQLSTENDKLMVGEASVVTPNIQVQGANLRIYSIDKVLDQGGQQAASAADGRNRG